ncbi:MAG: hypothetical protein ABIN18_28960 [Pseudomonadota bacterium]
MKKIVKYITLSLMMTLLITVFIGTGLNQACAADKPIVWIFASSSGAAANVWQFNPYPRFQKLVEKATGAVLFLILKSTCFPLVGP